MVFHLSIQDKTFECNYSAWNNIRQHLIKIAVEYLKELFLDDETTLDSIQCTHKKYLLEIIPIIEESKYNVHTFIYLCKPKIFDALTIFNIHGIYSLCYKSDTEGFYTFGNALDIKHFLKITTHIIENDSNKWLYEYAIFVHIEPMLQASISNKLPIRIH